MNTARRRRQQPVEQHHVVIVGAGFGGLYAARRLARDPDLRITVIDKRNYHLFQPLLYQVATGSLSPGEIATPIRSILRDRNNVRVIHATVTDLDPAARRVLFKGGETVYDTLIAATGVKHSYFGNDRWRTRAPGLKTVEHALEIRQRIFSAFEAAELEPDPHERRALLSFVVVGGGPTGVELAGALGELAHHTLVRDFHNIDTRGARIVLVEGAAQVLPSYPADLAAAATRSLRRLGVEVLSDTLVTDIREERVLLRHAGEERAMTAATVLWAAGVQASSFGRVLAERTGARLDRGGKVVVNADLSLPGYPGIFVIGDLAHFEHDGPALPGVAPVAVQQGRYVARLLERRRHGRRTVPFRYVDKGSMAVIGRHAAVAHIGPVHLRGFVAWLAWVVVHVTYLIEFGNKLRVMVQWAWTYFTRKRGVRLITSVPEAATEQARRMHL
ncbi:MAG TPA: NAD(P)/FAD-dependent oxidoreductase [Gammaproteobacteria bacterium]|nr:NAD(P)/FAD-dependent oxidoreductase [Gammaproteobacteria bacterium]